jgi:hypothetical protein
MSIAAAQITCTGCNFQRSFNYRPVILLYRIDDGSEIEAGRVFGWCSSCNDIRDIEAFMDKQQIREELEGAKRQARAPSRLIPRVVDILLGGGMDDLKKEIKTLEKQHALPNPVLADLDVSCVEMRIRNYFPSMMTGYL